MDRSLAARTTRSFGSGAAARRRRRPVLRHLRLRLRALAPRGSRARVALVCALIALPLLFGGWQLLRRSPLVAVSHVRVTGVSGPQAPAIEAALDAAARRMSTLDVNAAALRAAVAPFHLVRGLRVSTSFPHTLHVYIEEQPPAAALTVEGTRTAVAADGVVLGPALLRGSLPTVQASSAPPVGARVSNYYVQAALVLIGAAPRALAPLIQRAYVAPQGVAMTLRGGLVAYFGDALRPHAKWLSLARVLADPSSSGATYVDVRLPERPAAGFSASATEQTSTAVTPVAGAKAKNAPREASVQALAEGLGAPSGNAAANAAAAAAGTATSTSGTSETSEREAGAGAERGEREARSTSRESEREGHSAPAERGGEAHEGGEKESSTSTGG
jgi:cell division protein FtsQ